MPWHVHSFVLWFAIFQIFYKSLVYLCDLLNHPRKSCFTGTPVNDCPRCSETTLKLMGESALLKPDSALKGTNGEHHEPFSSKGSGKWRCSHCRFFFLSLKYFTWKMIVLLAMGEKLLLLQQRSHHSWYSLLYNHVLFNNDPHSIKIR